MTVVLPKALIRIVGVLVAISAVGAAYVAGTMNQSSSPAASATVVAATSSAAGSATPAATATAIVAPTATSTATQTPATSPPRTSTPTAAPTRTAAPAPTPITFTRAQNGGSSTSGKHTGIFGLVLADAIAGHAAPSRRVQVSAAIPNVGSLEKPSARAWIYNDFVAPAGGNVQAQIAGTIKWQGVLAGNGAAGAGAGIKIEVKVLDGSTLVASQTVHTKEIRESAMTIGGLDDVDEENFSFNANLQAGRTYRVQLEATCSAFTGLLGTTTHCIFGPSERYDPGFVEWTALSVRF